jgi:Protein of unknown function (DUF1593)
MKKFSSGNQLICALACAAAALSFNPTPTMAAPQKPRVIATTDGEVDDRSTMIRFLLYSCDFDVAGIVQVNSKYQKNGHSDKKWVESELDAYEKVLPNLRKHNPDYPDASKLRSVVRVGNENIKDLFVAPPDMQTKNTPGEQLIIDKLLDNDPRPVHVLCWGGANTTASALWKLKTEYSKEKFDYAVSRIRIYCIWYQDGGGGWIQTNIPGAYINEAYKWNKVWDYQSISNAPRNRPSANPPEIQKYMDYKWLSENVTTNRGPLGAMYPQTYVSEGDTPSFLNLIYNGLEAHLDYTLGGWGGRSAHDDPAFPNHITDKNLTDDGDANKMFWRWIPAAQNDFAARLNWCMANDYTNANHNPIAVLNGDRTKNILTLSATNGATIALSAEGTGDPDGNSVRATWWIYPEAGNISGATLTATNGLQTEVHLPQNKRTGKLHVILQVEDDGNPHLFAYRRAIIEVQP